MCHHEQRLQQQSDGPHAEQTLEHDQQHQHERQPRRLRGIAPVRPGAGRDREDQQTEPGREIAVQHLLERLARLERPFGIRAVRVLRILERLADRQVTVTAGPVRAAETGVTQAHPGAQHDDAQREQRAGKTQTMEQSGSHEACLFSRCVKVAAIV